MQLLKQSTSVVVSFGPFVDAGDGVTPETGLVSALDHATTGIMLSKNGGSLAVRNPTVTASTYDAYGNYRVTLDTTDTGTLGRLRMQFIETATCVPVWEDFTVVPANVYDALVLGTDALQVHANEITAGLITAAAIATGAIDADAIADNAIDAGAIATDAITSAEIAASGANKIADHTIRRTFQNACDSSDGDTKAFRSLLGAIATLVNKIAPNGSNLEVFEDDDTTVLGARTMTTDSGADPITALDTT